MRSDPRRVGVSERRSLPCSSLITGCRGKGSTRLQALAKLEKFEWYYEASSKQYQGNIATKAFDDECVLSKDSEVHGLTRKGCSRSSSHGCLPVFDLYYVCTSKISTFGTARFGKFVSFIRNINLSG